MPGGVANFARKHADLLPALKRGLRERGVSDLHTFLFHAPMVSKPSFLVSFSMPAFLDAKEEFIKIVTEERQGQEWEQLLSSVHDAAASKNNPWYTTIAPEIQAAVPKDGAAQGEGA